VAASSSPPDLTREGSPAPGTLAESAGSALQPTDAVRLRRVRGRSSFAALRRASRRARSGPIGVHYDPALPPDLTRRVAYAVPRRIGKAAERNRCRRRLREVAREVVPQVPPGAYLIGVEPGVRDLSFQELRRRVTEAMQRASRAGEW
jgi:ribonuclease P protein component